MLLIASGHRCSASLNRYLLQRSCISCISFAFVALAIVFHSLTTVHPKLRRQVTITGGVVRLHCNQLRHLYLRCCRYKLTSHYISIRCWCWDEMWCGEALLWRRLEENGTVKLLLMHNIGRHKKADRQHHKLQEIIISVQQNATILIWLRKRHQSRQLNYSCGWLSASTGSTSLHNNFTTAVRAATTCLQISELLLHRCFFRSHSISAALQGALTVVTESSRDWRPWSTALDHRANAWLLLLLLIWLYFHFN